MADWKDVAQKVSSFAPLLSGVLAMTGVGAPIAAAVAAAGTLASSALGVPNTPDDVAQALKTDPDAAVKLRQIDADHARDMQQLLVQANANQLQADTARMQAEFADVDSARKREIAVGSKTTPVLAWIVVAASLALGAAAVMGYITKDPTQASLVGTVVGYLFSESKQVLNYYFGSSAGSARKDIALADK